MEIIYTLEDFPDPGDRDLHDGIKEINKSNYRKALEYFEKSSKYDNEYGSLFAALFYFGGLGLKERNPAKALKLFKVIASTWNNRVAQYLIGEMYCEGDIGVPRDEKTGVGWLVLAANNGWSNAMVCAAISYQHAGYVGDKLKPAVAWLEKVAGHDNTDGELIDDETPYLFENKDFELCQGDFYSEIKSIVNSTNRYQLNSPVKGMEISMSDSEDYRATLLWDILSNKKSSGVSTAQLVLSQIYSSEETLFKNIDKALYWAKKSAKNKEVNSYVWLGEFYSVSGNIEPNYKEAMKWLQKAYHTRRAPSSSFYLGFLYKEGKGVKRNYSMALKLLEEFVINEGGVNGEAHFLMGDIYQDGDDGVTQDYRKAYECFLKAYELGNSDGAAGLGTMYCKGLGVERNIGKALHWFTKAGPMGASLAEHVIKKCMS